MRRLKMHRHFTEEARSGQPFAHGRANYTLFEASENPSKVERRRSNILQTPL
jgi:hypothetical protein